jgi:poly-gamma-glutamate capsule biosynthesis protein CapA/YwtB (metallophosphatase superfamily)
MRAMLPSLVSALVLAAAPPSEPFLRLRAVGDVMLGTTVPEGKLPPDDGAHLLEAVLPLLQDADLTFANLEGPLCDSGSSSKCRRGGNCFAFRSPTAYGRYLEAAGIDLASTANNHAGDFGEQCRRETEATLEKHHVAWSGPAGTVARVAFKQKKLSLIAFHTSASCNDVNDVPTAKRLVETEQQNGADLVIVSFHGGAEGTNQLHVKDGRERFLGENRGDLKKFTHAVIDSGADLVLGHGPHVVRAMEVYKGRLIAYSHGNFATYGRFDLSGPLGFTVLLEVSLAQDGTFLGGKLISTKQEGQGVPALDDTNRGAKLVRKLTLEDFPRTGVRINETSFELSAP